MGSENPVREYVSPLEPGEDPRVGDLVQVFSGPWGTAVICKIEGNVLYLTRPYILSGRIKSEGDVATGSEYFSTHAKNLMFWRQPSGRLYNRPRE